MLNFQQYQLNSSICVWKNLFFPDCLKISYVVHVYHNDGKRSTAHKYYSASLFLLIVKYLKNFQRIDLLIISRNVASFQISVWFQVFSVNCRSSAISSWWCYSTWHLIYPRLLVKSSMLAFLTNSSLKEF